MSELGNSVGIPFCFMVKSGAGLEQLEGYHQRCRQDYPDLWEEGTIGRLAGRTNHIHELC